MLITGIFLIVYSLLQCYQSQNITKYILSNKDTDEYPDTVLTAPTRLVVPSMNVVVSDLTWYTTSDSDSVNAVSNLAGGRPLKAPRVGWEDDWMMKWKYHNYDPTERLDCTTTKPSPYESGFVCHVPAYLPARIQRPNAKKIPRVIFLTWMTRELGPQIYTSIKTLLHNNPEYELVFFTDADIDQFMCENFSQGKGNNGSITDSFSRLQAGAARADVWRMMMIGRYGGVYLDVDESSLAPLPIDNDFDSVVSGVGGWVSDTNQVSGLLEHWALAYSPNHPVILGTIETILYNIKNTEKFEKGGEFWSDDPEYSFTIAVTGPSPYQTALHDVLRRVGCRAEVDPDDKSQSYVEALKDPKKYCGKNYPKFLEVVGNFKSFDEVELNNTIISKILHPDDEKSIMERTWDYDDTVYAVTPVDSSFCTRQSMAKRKKANQDLWERSVWKRANPDASNSGDNKGSGDNSDGHNDDGTGSEDKERENINSVDVDNHNNSGDADANTNSKTKEGKEEK